MGSDCPDLKDVSGRSGEMGVSGGLGKKSGFWPIGREVAIRKVSQEGGFGLVRCYGGGFWYKVGHQFPPTVVVLCKLLSVHKV